MKSDYENKQKLQDLYPFLHNKKQDADSMSSALLESVTRKFEHHQSVFESFVAANQKAIVDMARTVATAYQENGKLFTMGCGGSSSDASHIAVEFLHPVTTGRPALPAYDLTSDKTLITAIANDVGFEHAFMRQTKALISAGDVLIGVSTSGNSQSLIKAFRAAREKGAATIALLGGDGGETMNAGLDHCLVVESDSIHRIQECHVFIYHVLWDLVHTLLADERGDLQGKQRVQENT